MSITQMPLQPQFDSTLTKTVGSEEAVVTRDNIQNEFLSRMLAELRLQNAYLSEIVGDTIAVIMEG